MANNEKLLDTIRERFQYCVDSWKEVRDEARIDMFYVVGQPWESTSELRQEKTARKANGRPCLSLDELSQYINQRIGDIRVNKRAIKVTPNGYGANEKTAETRSNIIRRIESDSKAQAAYTTAFENALQRGYGWFRIGKRYVSEDSFEQELYIGRIPNPDVVYVDPDYKEADASDMRFAFVVDEMPREVFERRWPRANPEDQFPADAISQYPLWVREKSIQVAEYWSIENKKKTLILYGSDDNPKTGFIGEGVLQGAKLNGDWLTFSGGKMEPILNRRPVDVRSIVQRITNGLSILEETEWEGKWIPLVPVFGKEIWYESGSGTKRIYESLIRKARDAELLYCYYASAEQELVGQVPKTPWIGYEGQFAGHEDEWASVNRKPLAYLEVKATLPDVTGGQPLPLPTRNLWEPPVQAVALGKEQAKRAIQNAMGMYNASVGRSDSAGRSGIAIKALDLQSDQGNYHFLDNHDRALEHAGRILDDMIQYVYDTAREIGVKKPDDTEEVIEINKPSKSKDGSVREIRMDQGRHAVSITTGPSYESQREEAAEFIDAMVQQPAIFTKIADLAVKIRQLGPYGDEMAKRLTPPDVAMADQANPQALMAKIQQSDQMIQMMTQRLNEMTETLNAKKIELQSREKISAEEIASKERMTKEEIASNERIALVKAQIESAKIASQENIAAMQAELDMLKNEIASIRGKMPQPYESFEGNAATNSQSIPSQGLGNPIG